MARLGEDSKLVTEIKGLEDSITKGFTQTALDLICTKGGADDLSLVRKLLKGDFVSYSNLHIEYLRQHGEWQDIPLIIASVERPDYSVLLFSYPFNSKYRSAARAIYAIGKRRLPELLKLPMPSSLRAHLIVEASHKAFGALSDEQVKTLLLLADDAVRKAAAVKVVRAFPKKRLRRLLDEYISREEERYYNVIHWLDLGASAPQDIAWRAAAK